jgi:putative thiamine transport system substrate-binding protein
MRLDLMSRYPKGGEMLLRVLAAICALTLGQAASAASFDDALAEARGQTVYWHAWGGDPQIND